MQLANKKIVLGVTGSIAAYKAVLLLRELSERGADVAVVMTPSAQRFVTPLTFQVLSRQPVHTDLFEPRKEILHLTLAEEANLVLIAPATAHFIARAAHGMADDLLTALMLATTAPVILAPAMDGNMWDHPMVQQNIARLCEIGVRIVEPEVGPLASGNEGKGRLAAEDRILEAVFDCFERKRDLAKELVLVTAGPTQEPIDPIRFLSNRSSGKMGYAMAEAARDRGARVILISGPTALPKPAGIEFVEVRTSEEMYQAVKKFFPKVTMLIMAAAVADFRPQETGVQKRKKDGMPQTLGLEKTPDILAEVSRDKEGRLVVGFAAETHDLINQAKTKLQKKNLDLIVANDVTMEGAGFEVDTNIVTLLDRSGLIIKLPKLSKREVAGRILDHVTKMRR
ncbi:MAG TPA: bifunctional phosphopantothenoylcysteine decarboxylase/phosphopantothenate--cysteine ligase CoaBC [Nitrospiria bacterium]|jgi:phosphopantothenoylcysteine decarboxylase/phosphopantothenate--cysteine ligase|nr:bifunctional phosphopantothenoylcysteine decarboxylase/phosphopantothenate--cysteine ligase CoaBC [Nitrospiria bacterium]